MNLREAIEDKQILVVCGAGGVGKTSVSAALALAGSRTRNTIVLTIDPAKRLATALGLDGVLGHEERVVPASGTSFHAAMLDMRTAWDDLVDRYAPSAAVAERIRANGIYRGLSEHFVGSHSYMAMERLADLAESGTYDFIVIDTPPTRRALDFLDAPKRMTDFVGGSLLRWFARPYTAAGRVGARAFHLTASPLLKLADRVLGSQLLEELAEFVLDFQTLYDDFKRRAAEVLRLLHDRRTGFVVVSTLESPPLQEAGFFLDRLADERLPLVGIVANRVAPDLYAQPSAKSCAEALHRADADAVARAAGMDARRATVTIEDLRTHLDGYVTLAERDARRIADLRRRTRASVHAVPLLEHDLHDVESLEALARHLVGSG